MGKAPWQSRHVPAMDGVRGIAVLLVFLFHLRVSGFQAGFLGVDIFFVLSGFLITSLLLEEMQRTGRIALASFWSRRIRRLMPALVLLLLVVAVVASLSASFTERGSIRGDLLATTTYVANWHFIGASSYFVNTGVASPLKHTWSLAIEEQFYVLWPLLLAGAMTLLKRPKLVVAVLSVAGATVSALAMAHLWAPGSVERAYMGTDARICEPLVGAIGAMLVAAPGVRRLIERTGSTLALAGATGVAISLLVIRSNAPPYYFGGAVALSACTMMVLAPLWLGRGGRVKRGLEWKPLVRLGVISYGVYLWHWPLLVWLHVNDARGLDALARGLMAVGLAIGAATLSFYLIERPIRSGRGIRGYVVRRERTVQFAVRPRLVLGVVPLVMLAVAGTAVAATIVPPIDSAVPVVMLAGDSVPLHLQVPFEREAATFGWRTVSAARGACSITGQQVADSAGDPLHTYSKCTHLVVPLQESLIRRANPGVVVWWDRWTVSDFLTKSGKHVKAGTWQFWRLRRMTLRKTVHRLTARGAKVLFVATEPPGIGLANRCDPRCSWWVHFQLDHYRDVTRKWNDMLRRYAALHPRRAAFVSFIPEVCRTKRVPCDDRIDGVPARPDGTHYAGPAARMVCQLLAEKLASILPAKTV